MPAPARKPLWRSLRRRLGLAVSLLAYLATTFGYPLPANAKAAPACQDAPCGCPVEQHEHKQCCCFTGDHPAQEETAPAGHFCCAAKKHAAPILRWTVSLSALGCQGHATEWVSSGAVTTPQGMVVWLPETLLVELRDCPDLFGFVGPRTPPLPPPRS